MKPTNDKYPAIVKMLKAGRTFADIAKSIHVSYNTISLIRRAEGIPAQLGGKSHLRASAPEGSTEYVANMWDRQAGECGICELPLSARAHPIPGPNDSLAICLACDACYDIMSKLRWNETSIRNIHGLYETFKREGEQPTCTGGKYLSMDGPDVMAYLDGRLCVMISEHPIRYKFIKASDEVFPDA